MRGPLSREQALEMALAHALVRQADAGEFDEVLRFYQPLRPLSCSAAAISTLVILGDEHRLQRVLRGVYDMLGQPFDEGSVGSVGAEVAGLQATDLIAALVRSCTGGRTESFATRRHSIWRTSSCRAMWSPLDPGGPAGKVCPAERPSPST